MKTLISKLTGQKATTTKTYGEYRLRDAKDATLARYFTCREDAVTAWSGYRESYLEQKINGSWCWA
jgi:hypothetical protein